MNQISVTTETTGVDAIITALKHWMLLYHQ
jgi:hypothetical protein